nr:roadblock/LC7 domain-containing protein [Streptomyces sp. CBMA29]
MRRVVRQRADKKAGRREERRNLMAQEAEIREELRRLRARLPHATGALAAGVDGMVLAQEADTVEAEGVAALTAAALGVGLRLTDTASHGPFRELLVRGERGYVAIYAAGTACVLTVLAGPQVNVGRLHMEARRSGAHIAHLVDGDPEPREDAPTP